MRVGKPSSDHNSKICKETQKSRQVTTNIVVENLASGPISGCRRRAPSGGAVVSPDIQNNISTDRALKDV